MSYQAVDWVMESAPPMDANSSLVLIALAHRMDHLGYAAYPSASTIAEYWHMSVRTVMRKLRELETAGIIVRGDQAEADKLKTPGRKPVVYDLNEDAKKCLLALERRKRAIGIAASAVT